MASSTQLSQASDRAEGQGQSSFVQGDLGMGRGLKPGAISVESEKEQKSSFTKLFCSHQSVDAAKCPSCDSDWATGQTEPRAENSVHSFPSFAGVPFGTSLRQHRRLCEVSRKGLSPRDSKHKSSIGPEGDADDSTSERESLSRQLREATEELDILQNELEVCQSHLASKYRAIKILQHQITEIAVVSSKYQENEDEVKTLKTTMEKEVNALQFELDMKIRSLRIQEETWSEKYNRVSRENTVLLATLQSRNAENRRLHAEKLGLTRERDELLARMDANERLRYDQHWTPKHDSDYLEHTLSDQLAILGACMCRGSKPEPCQCARIAAILTKENGLLKDEIERLKQKLVESVLVSDAFRKAFDEQLQCNTTLLRNMTDTQKLAKEGQNRQKKPFWQKKSNTDVLVQRPLQVQYALSSLPITRSFEEEDHMDHRQRTVGLQVSQPIPDSSNLFEEMLQDKSEALAHQRLVSKLLAQKTQDLEKAVKRAESLMKH